MNRFVDFLTSAVLGIAGTAAIAFWLMIGVGAIHGEWLPDMPTLGYGSAVLIAIPFEFIVSIKRVEHSALESR